jgi:LPXTG-site transpeptidase (sortase) family protein
MDNHNTSLHAEPVAAKSEASPKTKALINVAKKVGPFIAVFVVGIFLYYFFFSSVNFSSVLTSSTPKASTPQETALEQLEAQDKTAYDKWIAGFYYDVTDPKILDPNSDNSGNGLSNFEKYLLNLNPKSYDTLGLGIADSQAISNGLNPNTGTNLTDNQKGVIAKYVDMEVVMNRLALNNLQNPGKVAGASISSNSAPGTQLNIGGSFGQPITTGQSQSQSQSTISYNTQSQSNTQQTNNSNYITPTLGSEVDVDTKIPGRLEIPDLKINVPIIFSNTPNDFEKDLQVGVVHYPGTAFPGQIGTTYIAGHSSNYIWAKGDYNKVFATLGNLAINSSFKITVVQKNGKNAVFYYVVTSKEQFTPTDPKQFANSGSSIVALSTCWPVGSTAKRLVAFGTLTQVEK